MHFKTDNKNNLLIKAPGDKNYNIASGVFKIEQDNQLVFKFDDDSSWHKRLNLPNKIVLDGDWQLDKNHGLVLTLNKTKARDKETLKLRGNILGVFSDSVLFEIKSMPDDKIKKISYLKLKGAWCADRFNRLVFEVKRLNRSDNLVFTNFWQLNKNKEIIYSYDKLPSSSKHILTFKGFWRLESDKQINYVMEGSGDSYFNFNASLETPSLYPKKDTIKYRVGIGCKNKKEYRVILFSGTFKFNRSNDLIFDLDTEKGKLSRVYFSYLVRLKNKDKLEFIFLNKDKEPMGMKLVYSIGDIDRDNFEYFMKLSREKDDSISFGLRRRF